VNAHDPNPPSGEPVGADAGKAQAEADTDAAQLAPDLNVIREHIHALCDPAFTHAHPNAVFELAYGHPVIDGGDVNEARTCSALNDKDLRVAAEVAARWNANGYNAYAGAALRQYGDRTIPPDRRGKVEDYLASRFAWVDFDKAGDAERIEAVLKDKGLVPALIVTTGTIPHRRGQIYFLVTGIRDAAHLKQINSVLQRLLGTDAAVTGAQQVLRLAGSVSYPTDKKAARGYVAELTTLMKIDKAPTYSADHLIGLCGAAGETASGTEQRQQYDRRSTSNDAFDAFDAFAAYGDELRFEADPALIASALAFVPNNDLEWDEWKRVLLAAWRATNGSDAALGEIDKWSSKSRKYDADYTRREWKKISKSPPNRIGAGTIFKLALDNGWEWPRRAFVGRTADGGFDFNYAEPKGAETGSNLIEQVHLFDAAQPLQGSLAEQYLTGVGLTVPDVAHEVLRFHPHFGDPVLPCLIAYVQDGFTNEPAGLHLTALGTDATATDRKLVSPVDCHGAIKLGGEPDASGDLTIAASIESALAAMACGFSPAWSVLSVQGIADFPKPRFNTIKRLTVIVDSDEAVEAAAKCKARWGNVARIVVRSV
jgi:hypothetical protein